MHWESSAARQKLEVATNVAILLFVAFVGVSYFREKVQPKPQALKVGDSLPRIAGQEWGNHPRTLLLALKYGCKYCDESAPFYKRLIELRRSGGPDEVRFLALFPDDHIIAQRTLQLEWPGSGVCIIGRLQDFAHRRHSNSDLS